MPEDYESRWDGMAEKFLKYDCVCKMGGMAAELITKSLNLKGFGGDAT